MAEPLFTFGETHSATVENIERIIALNEAIGNTAAADIYEDALAKLTGVHRTKLF